MPPFIKVAIFCDTVLVSNYHSCKGEAIKLITYCMIDIICKTVKPSHLKKLKIMQNIKKPNVRILIKQIITLILQLGETDFRMNTSCGNE